MRVAILGNAGSGKSTLAALLARVSGAPVLDLDTIVWEPGKVAVRRPPEDVRRDLSAFCSRHERWVVEGCYGDLIEIVLVFGPELIFLNPGAEACLRRCRERPWEPHELELLLGSVSDYYHRDDDMSLARHQSIYERYAGTKREIRD